jgi:hypothetical protein
VPAHSKRPLSRETLNVISVGMIGMAGYSFKNRRKFGYVLGLKTILITQVNRKYFKSREKKTNAQSLCEQEKSVIVPPTMI